MGAEYDLECHLFWSRALLISFRVTGTYHRLERRQAKNPCFAFCNHKVAVVSSRWTLSLHCAQGLLTASNAPPAFFTDYCEEATCLAAQVLTSCGAHVTHEVLFCPPSCSVSGGGFDWQRNSFRLLSWKSSKVESDHSISNLSRFFPGLVFVFRFFDFCCEPRPKRAGQTERAD